MILVDLICIWLNTVPALPITCSLEQLSGSSKCQEGANFFHRFRTVHEGIIYSVQRNQMLEHFQQVRLCDAGLPFNHHSLILGTKMLFIAAMLCSITKVD